MPNGLKIISKYKLKGDKCLKKYQTTFFFQPTPMKQPKNMPNYGEHTKQHFLMPNHFKKANFQEFGI